MEGDGEDGDDDNDCEEERAEDQVASYSDADVD